MANTPEIKNAMEDDPEMTALVHPNSAIKGLKKTPNETYEPMPIAWIPKQDTTILLAGVKIFVCVHRG